MIARHHNAAEKCRLQELWKKETEAARNECQKRSERSLAWLKSLPTTSPYTGYQPKPTTSATSGNSQPIPEADQEPWEDREWTEVQHRRGRGRQQMQSRNSRGWGQQAPHTYFSNQNGGGGFNSSGQNRGGGGPRGGERPNASRGAGNNLQKSRGWGRGAPRGRGNFNQNQSNRGGNFQNSRGRGDNHHNSNYNRPQQPGF